MQKNHRGQKRKNGMLEVRKSGVHGRGVFANTFIRKDTRIIEYTGRRISWADVSDDVDEECTYYFGLDNGKVVIDPTIDGNEARWINHSCDPNCEAIEDSRGRVFIYALRDLRPGEELFYDYRLEVDGPRTEEVEQENRCFCGSSNCRKTMLVAG
jgi:uncharacterized protein